MTDVPSADPNAGVGSPDDPPTTVRRDGGLSWLRGVAIVAVVLIGVAALLYVARLVSRQTAGAERPTPPAATPSQQSPTPSRPAPSAGGEVRLLDWGFSVGSDSKGNAFVSYGIMVENTSNQLADYNGVEIRMLDKNGRAVAVDHRRPVYSAGQAPKAWKRTVREVRPGESAGIGGYLYVERADVATMQIKVLTTGEWTKSTPVFKRLEIKDIELRRGAEVEVGGQSKTIEDGASLRFSAKSYRDGYPSNCVESVLFDSAGKVVGGGLVFLTEPSSFKSGWNRASGVLLHTSSKADLRETRVYAYPVCNFRANAEYLTYPY